MLTQLSIRNFAIIEEITLTLEDGLTVLTGETGAGKSIIIDALQLLAGGRGSVDYVRHGAKRAEIEGLFTFEQRNHPVFDLGNEYGIDLQDQMLVLQRTITHQGKSICRINGKLVTLAILREFGKTLVDIHSQHETQTLMDPSHHLELLDLYCLDQISSIKEDYFHLYRKYRQLKQAYEALNTDEQELAHRLDLLEFQQQEISQAQLLPNEDDDLEEERSQLANFEKLYLNIYEAYNALSGQQQGLDWISKAKMALSNIASYDKNLQDQAETLTTIFYTLEDLASELREYGENLHYDEQRLNEVEGRLDEIQRLKKKYGSTVNDILEYAAKIEEEIEQIENKDSHAEQLHHKMVSVAKDAYLEAKELHALRQKGAKKLMKEIEHELKELHLENVSFSIHFEPFPSFENDDSLDDFTFYENGLDQIQFMISTNIGEPLKPIDKVASGGELSRIMLALKKIFAKHQGITSVIFDEVDTGVSGRVAQAMAEKIVHISKDSQVLCITHLPQVAAMADTHFLITKEEKKDRTITYATELTNEEKILELSAMMTGSKVTSTAKEHGRKLLDLAKDFKEKITT